MVCTWASGATGNGARIVVNENHNFNDLCGSAQKKRVKQILNGPPRLQAFIW